MPAGNEYLILSGVYAVLAGMMCAAAWHKRRRRAAGPRLRAAGPYAVAFCLCVTALGFLLVGVATRQHLATLAMSGMLVVLVSSMWTALTAALAVRSSLRARG